VIITTVRNLEYDVAENEHGSLTYLLAGQHMLPNQY